MMPQLRGGDYSTAPPPTTRVSSRITSRSPAWGASQRAAMLGDGKLRTLAENRTWHDCAGPTTAARSNFDHPCPTLPLQARPLALVRVPRSCAWTLPQGEQAVMDLRM